MKKPLRIGLAACAAVLALVASASGATLRVFAAASLAEAFQEIAADFRADHPGVEVEFNFAGSQILRVQLEEGAGADVFASADHAQMDPLRVTGLVGADSVFARNRLVVVTPKNDPKVKRLVDLSRPGIKLVIADGNVPVGRYTTQVLGKMNRAGLYGDDFQRRFLANVVSQETNVRAVLAKVSLDVADAGVVYATDARTAVEKTAVIKIPERFNVVAEYPIAVVSESPVPAAAQGFVARVLSEAGQDILSRFGFEAAR